MVHFLAKLFPIWMYFLSSHTCLRNIFGAAAIAQWKCLCKPYCGPGFESRAQYQFIFELWCEKNENDQKEAKIGPFFLSTCTNCKKKMSVSAVDWTKGGSNESFLPPSEQRYLHRHQSDVWITFALANASSSVHYI